MVSKTPVTFTRSTANSNDGAHVGAEERAIARAVVGHHRYDTPAELLLLNKIWLSTRASSNESTNQSKRASWHEATGLRQCLAVQCQEFGDDFARFHRRQLAVA